MATVTFVDTANDGTLSADTQYSTTPGAGDTIIVAAGTKDLTGDAQSLTNIPGIWQFRFRNGRVSGTQRSGTATRRDDRGVYSGRDSGETAISSTSICRLEPARSKVAIPSRSATFPVAAVDRRAFDVIEAYNVGRCTSVLA